MSSNKGTPSTIHHSTVRENPLHDHPLNIGQHPHYKAEVVTRTGQTGRGSGSTKEQAIASAQRDAQRKG